MNCRSQTGLSQVQDFVLHSDHVNVMRKVYTTDFQQLFNMGCPGRSCNDEMISYVLSFKEKEHVFLMNCHFNMSLLSQYSAWPPI